MLPDYPRAKEKLSDLAFRRFRAVIRELTLDVESEPVLEGDSVSYTRHDGSGETIQFQQFKSTIEIADAEYSALTWKDVVRKVEESAAEMGNEMFRHMLDKVDEITKETGNRVDAGGNLTPEKFLELLGRIEIQFDLAGNPILPTIVGGDVASRAVKKVLQDISSSTQLQRQMDLVIETQKERWRDRESARKLVD